MTKKRRQTYTMDMYLNKVRDLDIRNDADVQRQFVWSNEQVNELIVTVLTDDYMPPIILGEEDSSQLWIVDGGQRTAALKKYRHGNYKITSAVENSVIPYREKARDGEGKVLVDADGNIVWEDAAFDILNMPYDRLPDELKKKFNEYQIETVIHEHCDNHRISQLIKRYNNHTSMNTNQKAFTYIDNFARDIREMLDYRFFLECSSFTETEKVKGVVERVIVETVMCTGHLDHWKKQTKAICAYLNEHAAKEEFERLAGNLRRLEKVVTGEARNLFNSKDAFLFLTLFDRFTSLGIGDSKYVEFLGEFQNRLRHRESEGRLFDGLDRGKGTKDRAVIRDKLEMLENLMGEFLHIEGKDGVCNGEESVFSEEEIFIAENVGIDPMDLREDMALFRDTLEDLEERTIRYGSRLLEYQNRLSLLAIVAYSYRQDIDLEGWMKQYAEENNTYCADQKKNYRHMLKALHAFLKCGDRPGGGMA